ncbi:MAG: nucleoside monophosphate kinase [Bdellovibrionaceae bacterium]|nr:nucleoside monophosphate kinase [Pseudobdellovibrionaceae bacterium]
MTEWVLLLKLKVGEFVISIILFGAPGSGKGTQASLLHKEYGIPHISTGNLFSYEISNKTDLGLQVKKCMVQGQLVSDDIVVSMLGRALEKNKNKKIILDGFPRNQEQGKILKPLLEKHNLSIRYVFFLEVSDAIVIQRITGRRTCHSCKASWHIEYVKPKKEGICDFCQSPLEQRKDDTAKVVKHRLEVYHESANSLKGFYKGEGILHTIKAEKSSDEVFQTIKRVYEGKEKS